MKKLTLLLAAVLTVLGANAWTVKFTNPDNWTKVYAYTFPVETEGAWPGSEMTKEGDVWTLTGSSEEVPGKIIFNNNNGSQTANLDFVAEATYDMNGPVGAEMHTYTVYFDNSTANWAEVYAYTFQPEVFGGWPGKKLEKNADGLYVASYEATSEQSFGGLIFNNGNGSQTDGFTWENDATYNENGKVGDEPVIKKFGLVGSIAEQGWNIGAPIEMEETEENVFSYGLESVAEGALFKIATIAEYATEQEAWDNTYGAEAPLGSEDAPNINVVNAGPLNAWLKSSSNFYFAKAMTDVTITFTYSADASVASTVTVTGTVVENPAQIDATFNFSEIAQSYPASDWKLDGRGPNKLINVTGTVFTSNGITLVDEKTEETATDARLYLSSGVYDFRVYQKNIITISAPEGFYIESIEAYSVVAASSSKLADITCDEDLVAAEALTANLPEGMKSGRKWTPASNNTLRQVVKLTPTNKSGKRISLLNVVAKQSPTSVEGIGEDVDENAPVEYYNLNGVRVAEPENGIFIRRQGSKVTKIIVR